MSRVALLTAVYDSYDDLKPVFPQSGVDVEWIAVTDRVPDAGRAEGWRIVHEPRPGVHPNRAAKHPKFEPWKYTDAPVSVWVDASFRVVSETFVTEALSYADPIAQFVHPWRQCLFDEAAESARLPKYVGEPVLAQADYYAIDGHPPNWGLWATGVIARQHTDAVREFGARWLAETYEWSYQDQISEPYVLRETGLRPAGFPGMHLATPWLAYEGSVRH